MSNSENMQVETKEEVDFIVMKRAAYALNMCTVSVGQIIDYNDELILDQEYSAILNNLNLENIPDDEAFLQILVELLNTISFFRIQEKKKHKMEAKYQDRMRNAIWSAVPSIGAIVVSKEPAPLLFSLATQVGSSYMNYRKEKARAKTDYDNEQFELELAAIEQLHAIQRELFTTSWRIAKEYKFPDNYRITEKQIKQYNAILMDNDDIRKFIRLEAIKDKFIAYPPFWYHLGHTAAYIATNKDNEYNIDTSEKSFYIEQAKKYFNEYDKMNKYNILREDQLTASFALEYIDLLLPEKNKKSVSQKISRLIKVAVAMSGCSLDIMQLCAISYLHIGEYENAADLFKQLVNEGYNVFTNAKLLSRVYVTLLMHSVNDSEKQSEYRREYKLLTRRINEAYLFPMPDVLKLDLVEQDKELQENYISSQKALLTMAFRRMITDLERRLTRRFNQVLFPGANEVIGYFDNSMEAINKREKDIEDILKVEAQREDYLQNLKNVNFKYRYLDILNETLNLFDTITIFNEDPKKDELVLLIRSKIVRKIPRMEYYDTKINDESFSVINYKTMQEELSYTEFTGSFFEKVKEIMIGDINLIDKIGVLESTQSELLELCQKENLSIPEIEKPLVFSKKVPANVTFFEYNMLGEGAEKERLKIERAAVLKKICAKYTTELVSVDPEKFQYMLQGDADFDVYFTNKLFREREQFKRDTIAILDDKTWYNDDLLFTVEGVLIVSKNEVKGIFGYDQITFENSSFGVDKIVIANTYEFYNGLLQLGFDVQNLKKLIMEIQKNYK